MPPRRPAAAPSAKLFPTLSLSPSKCGFYFPCCYTGRVRWSVLVWIQKLWSHEIVSNDSPGTFCFPFHVLLQHVKRWFRQSCPSDESVRIKSDAAKSFSIPSPLRNNCVLVGNSPLWIKILSSSTENNWSASAPVSKVPQILNMPLCFQNASATVNEMSLRGAGGSKVR